MPPGFRGDRSRSRPTGPSIASVAGAAHAAAPNNLPPAVVLPERLVHWSGGASSPAQFGGQMGRTATRGSSRRRPTATRSGAAPIPSTRSPTRPRSRRRRRDDRVFQAPNLTLPRGLDARAASHGRLELLHAARPASAASPGTARPRRRASTGTASRPISLLTDARGPAGLRRHAGRRPHAGALRPQQLRLVAADGPPAGRGRRQPGAGQPRQQRDLGHARRRLPAPEGQPLPADRPGPVRPARRPARQRPARQHADRDGRRVRPDAEALDAAAILQAARAATTGGRCRRSSSPAAASSGGTVVGSSDKIGGYPRQQPADAREHGRDDLPRPRHPRHRASGTTNRTAPTRSTTPTRLPDWYSSSLARAFGKNVGHVFNVPVFPRHVANVPHISSKRSKRIEPHKPDARAKRFRPSRLRYGFVRESP